MGTRQYWSLPSRLDVSLAGDTHHFRNGWEGDGDLFHLQASPAARIYYETISEPLRCVLNIAEARKWLPSPTGATEKLEGRLT